MWRQSAPHNWHIPLVFRGFLEGGYANNSRSHGALCHIEGDWTDLFKLPEQLQLITELWGFKGCQVSAHFPGHRNHKDPPGSLYNTPKPTHSTTFPYQNQYPSPRHLQFIRPHKSKRHHALTLNDILLQKFNTDPSTELEIEWMILLVWEGANIQSLGRRHILITQN